MRLSARRRAGTGLLTLAATVAGPAAAPAQSLSPTGYWQYNGGFVSTGTNTTNVVTLTAAPTATAPGVSGTAVGLNGTSQWLNLNVGYGTGSSLTGGYNLGGNFSVSTWYFVATAPSPNVIGGSQGRSYIWEGRTDFDLSAGTPGGQPSTLRLYGTGGTAPGTAQQFFDVAGAFATGTWRHLTQVYESDGTNSGMTAYLDGAQVGSFSAATQVADTGINLGNARTGQTRFLAGRLDETAVFDRALSNADVARAYSYGLNGVSLNANARFFSPTATSNQWLSPGANNWQIGTGQFAGEANNAASTNADVAVVNSFAFAPATLGIDMAAAGGNLAAGAVVFNSQTADLTITNSAAAAGVLTLNGANLNDTANTIISVRNTLNTTGSGNRDLTIGDGLNGALGLRLGTAASVVRVDAGRALAVNAVISERSAGSGLTFQGTGTTTLSRANLYTGPTAVSAGTLVVTNPTGSATGTGTVTVGAAGTLGGTGRIAGPLTVDGVLAPGTAAAPGTLTVANTVALSNGAVLRFAVANGAAAPAGANTGGSGAAGLQSLLAVTDGTNTVSAGNITLRVAELSATPLDPAQSYSWTVATGQSAPTLGAVTFDLAGAPNFAAYASAGGTFDLSVGGTSIYLNLAPVPEPAAALALALAGLGISRRVARRRSKDRTVTQV